jgi:hypothetical protein
MKNLIDFTFTRAFLFSTAVALASAANSNTIYDENISGDSYGGKLFSLTNIDNAFKGSQTWTDPVDGFRFVVADDQQIELHVDYSFSGLSGSDALAFIWDLWKLPDDAGTCSTTPDFEYGCAGPGGLSGTYLTGSVFSSQPGFGDPATPLGPDISTLLLGPGVYSFTDNFKFATSSSAFSGIFNYSIHAVNIKASVQEPGSLSLLGLGMGVLVAMRRRFI